MNTNQSPYEFDEIISVHGQHSEEYYTYDVNDYITFGKSEEDGNTIVTDSSDNSSINQSLLRYLHCFSTDPDSNEESRKLVTEYRKNVSNILGL